MEGSKRHRHLNFNGVIAAEVVKLYQAITRKISLTLLHTRDISMAIKDDDVTSFKENMLSYGHKFFFHVHFVDLTGRREPNSTALRRNFYWHCTTQFGAYTTWTRLPYQSVIYINFVDFNANFDDKYFVSRAFNKGIKNSKTAAKHVSFQCIICAWLESM